MATRKSYVAIFAIALSLSACGVGNSATTSSPKATEPYRILMIGAFTSPFSTIVQAGAQGIQAGIAVVNKTGGILGRQVEYEQLDDTNDPTKAVALLQQRLSSAPLPDLVIPDIVSTNVLALLPILTDAKIITFSNAASTPLLNVQKYPYHFGTVVPVPGEVDGFVSYFEQKGYKHIALIADSGATGQAVLQEYQNQLPKAGMTLSSESFNPGTIDMTPQLLRLQATNPDVLVIQGAVGGAVAGYILKARTKIGWKTPAVGGTALAVGDLTQVSSAADWVNLTLATWPVNVYTAPDTRSDAEKTFISAVQAIGPMSQSPQSYGAFYDTVELAAIAAKQANSTDSAKMAKALETLNVPSTPAWVDFPKYSFSSTNHFPAYLPGTFDFIPYTGKRQDGMFVTS